MKIQRVAMAMIIVFLTFYLLHLGQTLLLPLVIAGAIAYLISILAHAITKLAYKGFSVPKPLAMFVAIAIILLSLSYLIQLITVNIQSVIKVAPDYQQNLEALFFKAYSVFSEGEVPNIRDFLNQLDIGAYFNVWIRSSESLNFSNTRYNANNAELCLSNSSCYAFGDW